MSHSGNHSARGSNSSGQRYMHPSSSSTQNDKSQSHDSSVQPENILPELIPGVYWFSDPSVTRMVTSTWQQYYRQPYMSLKDTPVHVLEQWFRMFKTCYTWKPDIEGLVRKEFESVVQRRLKGHVCNAAKKKPIWMSDHVHKALIERRKSKAFIVKSQRNKNNKVQGSEKAGSSIAPGHHQGSISSAELALRMARDNNGVMPTAAELFRRSHSKSEGSLKVLGSEKAKKTMVEYELRIAHYKSKGVQKDPNLVYYEVVGGHKKGKVYGLGESAPLYFEYSTSKTNMSTTTSSVMRAMQAAELSKAIEEVNGVKRTILEELHNIRDLKHQYEEELAQLRSQSQCNNAFQPIPRDPRDPFDGGNGAPSSFPVS